MMSPAAARQCCVTAKNGCHEIDFEIPIRVEQQVEEQVAAFGRRTQPRSLQERQ
jgi:hypothetical protein